MNRSWLGLRYGADPSIETADVILVLDCDVREYFLKITLLLKLPIYRNILYIGSVFLKLPIYEIVLLIGSLLEDIFIYCSILTLL